MRSYCFVLLQLYLTVTFLRSRNLRNATQVQTVLVESVTSPNFIFILHLNEIFFKNFTQLVFFLM